jgi:hypothetical protein
MHEVDWFYGVEQMTPRKDLASQKAREKKLDKFLFNLVNANVGSAGDDTDYTFRVCQEFLPPVPSNPGDAMCLPTMFRSRWGRNLTLLKPQDYARGIISELREELRDIWNAKTRDGAVWRLRRLQLNLKPSKSANWRWPLPGPNVPIIQALSYLYRRLARLKRCANPTCTAPFFIAAKKKQQYCGIFGCAAVRQSQYKTEWWQRREVAGGSRAESDLPDTGEVEWKGSHNHETVRRIPELQLQTFVLDVANAPNETINDSALYFFTRYPAFFPTKEKDIESIIPYARRR